MISAGHFRKGTTFLMDGKVYTIVEFQHVKTGRGAAFARTKIKNILTGVIRDHTFASTEKFERASIETKDMQYLYNDGDFYYFMDLDTYEQIPVEENAIEDSLMYLKENDTATLDFFEGKVFDVTTSNFVELEVTETEPGLKGDTSSGATKPATVETGLTLNVPLFVSKEDIIKIDTRTGEYVSRL